MHNWNTDTSKWDKNSDSYRIWRLQQLINYGLNGEKIETSEIIKYWDKVKPQIDPERARMIEYLIWEKIYSIKNSNNFWNLSTKPRK